MIEKIKEKLDIAYKTEVNGYRFYLNAAKMVDDKHGKNMFQHLAKDELEHIKVVHTIGEELRAGKKWPRYEDVLKSGGTLDIEALPVFPEGNKAIEGMKGAADELHALDVGIGAEERSIELYLDILKAAEDPDEKAVLERLVEMERGHLKLLRWEHESLTNSGFWCDMMGFSVEKEM